MDSKVLRNLSYGMYIIGTKTDRNVGCVVNTTFQITSKPATVAVSINHDNYTNKIIKESNKFSVSILSEDINPEIIGRFGYQSSENIDKFKEDETVIVDDMPVLKDNAGYMICKVVNKMETETHTIFLGEVVDMGNYNEKIPMTYRYYHEVLKGKSPKNAPTYVEENKVTEKVLSSDKKENTENAENTEKNEKKIKTFWRCPICGYEIEIDELPDDFVCPICGQPKSEFIKIEKEV